MIRFGFGSCGDSDETNNAGNILIDDLGIKGFFAIGDMPYIGYVWTGLWGHTVAALTMSSVLQDYKDQYLLYHDNPTIKKITDNCDYHHLWHDHELPGNDWDHSVTQANEFDQGIGATDQDDVNAVYSLCRAAGEWEATTYCANSSGVILTTTQEIPAQVATGTYTASDYVSRGYRVGYDADGNVDNVNPLIEFFNLDAVTQRGLEGDPDTGTYPNHNKTMMGVEQVDEFLTKIAASTASYKVVIHPSNFLFATGSVNWAATTVERDYIFSDINTNVTGPVIFMSGDAHAAVALEYPSPNFFGFEVSNILRARQQFMNWDPVITSNYIWGRGRRSHFGLIEANEDRMVVSICDSHSGDRWYSGYFVPGSNVMKRMGGVALG